MVAGLGTTVTSVAFILNSNLPEAQKYFAVTVFFLFVVVLYGEVSYQKKSDGKIRYEPQGEVE
jgi:hypothetical protein